MQYVKGSVWIAEGFFTSKEVDEIYASANKKNWETGAVGNGAGDIIDPDGETQEHGVVSNEIRQSQVKWLMHEDLPQSFHEKLAAAIQYASLDKDWKWDFTNFENFQYTNYRHKPDRPRGDFYTWHTDAGGTNSTYPTGEIRKLSCTIQLSDPDDYEGGNFQWIEPTPVFDRLLPHHKHIDVNLLTHTAPFSAKTKGSVIIFPSELQHQVTSVSAGSRNSLVGWLLGPQFK